MLQYKVHNKNILYKTILFLEESLEAGSDQGGPTNFSDILSKALPDSDHSSCDSQSDRSSNSGEVSRLPSVWAEQATSGMCNSSKHFNLNDARNNNMASFV